MISFNLKTTKNAYFLFVFIRFLIIIKIKKAALFLSGLGTYF